MNTAWVTTARLCILGLIGSKKKKKVLFNCTAFSDAKLAKGSRNSLPAQVLDKQKVS